jgi:hypothetical protein
LTYIEQTLPFDHPMSAWLPNDQIAPMATGRWGFLVFSAWGCVAALVAIGLLLSARSAWARPRRFEPRSLLAALLFVTAVGWSATQAIRNTYESILMVPLLMLFAILAMPAGGLNARLATVRNAVAVLIGVGAIVSMALIAQLWRPSLTRSDAQAGYIVQQPYSVPVFGYAALEPDILSAARKCDIPDPSHANRVVIDDLTYFAFMRSHLPEHRLGLFGMWRGAVSDPVAYLKSRGSDGVIIGCHLLPDALRRRARRQGAFCCLGPQNW